MADKSIFQKNEEKTNRKKEHAALMTVIGPGNLLILVGIVIFLVCVIVFSVTVPINMTTSLGGVVAYGEGSVNVTTENEGILTQLSVSNGDYVQRGDILGVLTTEGSVSTVNSTAMLTDEEKSRLKRETMIVALESGVIIGLNYQDGEYLTKDTQLCQIVKKENKDTSVVILAYSSYEGAQNIKQGDKVFIELESAPTDKYGYLRGVVRNVKLSSIQQGTENPIEMQILIDPKVDDQGKYIWTKENNGFNGEITEGTSCKATVFTDKLYLINLVIS